MPTGFCVRMTILPSMRPMTRNLSCVRPFYEEVLFTIFCSAPDYDLFCQEFPPATVVGHKTRSGWSLAEIHSHTLTCFMWQNYLDVCVHRSNCGDSRSLRLWWNANCHSTFTRFGHSFSVDPCLHLLAQGQMVEKPESHQSRFHLLSEIGLIALVQELQWTAALSV